MLTDGKIGSLFQKCVHRTGMLSPIRTTVSGAKILRTGEKTLKQHLSVIFKPFCVCVCMSENVHLKGFYLALFPRTQCKEHTSTPVAKTFLINLKTYHLQFKKYSDLTHPRVKTHMISKLPAGKVNPPPNAVWRRSV